MKKPPGGGSGMAPRRDRGHGATRIPGRGRALVVLLLLTTMVCAAPGCRRAATVAPAEQATPLAVLEEPQLVAEWFLTIRDEHPFRIEYLADLADTLANRGFTVTALPGREYRLDDRSWIRTKMTNRTGFIRPRELFRVSATPDTLFTYGGMDADSLSIEITGAKIWLENLTQRPCPTFAYPFHEHDLRTLACVRDSGFLAARNGTISYLPWGSCLLGTDPEPWLRTWSRCSLFELPLTLQCRDIQEQAPEQIAAWLAAPERLPAWKDDNTWVHLYTHTDDPSITGTPTLDADHLAALLEALIADGDVWIAPVGEAADWLRRYFRPEDADGFIWIPPDPTGIDERSAGPWGDRHCVFSFSTDDGFKANRYSYAPVFAERELGFTAYLNPHKIMDSDLDPDSNYCSSAEVTQMAELGVEIGCHGMNHWHLLEPEVCLISREPGRPGDAWLEVVAENDRTLLRLYETAD